MAATRTVILCAVVLSWSKCCAFTCPTTTGATSARLHVHGGILLASSNNDDLIHDDFSSQDDCPEASAQRSYDGTTPPSASPTKQHCQPAFPSGRELQQLRTDLESYRENLKWAAVLNDTERVMALQKVIEEQERRDPEIVYNKAQYLVASAKASTHKMLRQDLKEELIDFWEKQANMARSYLPRFQLEGLWVGNYGKQGPQLVNVTYVGDMLVAVRVTGDTTVPRGEVSFTGDLRQHPKNNTLDGSTKSTDASSPNSSSSSSSPPPLTGNDDEAFYPGEGQISKQHFVDKRFVPGLLAVCDSTSFMFSWIPSKHHVLFTRPSPEETLWLLRDVIAKEDEVQNMRDYLARCFDMDITTSIARQPAEDQREPFRRIKLQGELDRLKEEKVERTGSRGSKHKSGAEQSWHIFSFWIARKWRKYIDRVLGHDDGVFE